MACCHGVSAADIESTAYLRGTYWIMLSKVVMDGWVVDVKGEFVSDK